MCVIKEGQVLVNPTGSRDSVAQNRTSRRCAATITAIAIVVAEVSAGVSMAPPAQADSADGFRDAVSSTRGGASCGSLHYSPVLEQAAEMNNIWIEDWLTHKATRMPSMNPEASLRHLGYSGTKAILLAGAGKNAADAIKGAVLEGYLAIPDCSYTEFGVSIRRNDAIGYDLTAAVLAGP
jgi:hypothetical protein